jgi:peptide/bleomycin uptake transporter
MGGPSVVILTIAVYLTRKYAFWWREAVTFHYIPLWRHVAAEIEGASQRIQEDVYRGTKVMEGLGWQLASSLFILTGFVPILWDLSRGVQLPVLAGIPGSLVWVAFAVSVGGLGISWLVGSKLPALEYDNQRVEAAFRKELVYGEDDKQTYASEAVLRQQFHEIRANSHRLFLHSAYFDLWKYAYAHTVWMVPFLVLSSGLFYGLLTFGVMMQVVDAFSRVNNSLGQFIHNWQMITEVRSIWRRLREFERNLVTPPATDQPAQVAHQAFGPERSDNGLVFPVKAELVAGAKLGSLANLGAEGLKLPEKYGAFIVTANIRERRQTRRHPHEHLLFWARRPMPCAPGDHRRVPHTSVDPASSGHPLARSCRYGAPRSATHYRQGKMVAWQKT